MQEIKDPTRGGIESDYMLLPILGCHIDSVLLLSHISVLEMCSTDGMRLVIDRSIRIHQSSLRD